MTLTTRVSTNTRKDQESDIPDTEQLSGSGTEGNVGASKVVNRSLGEHSVVLKLRLAERGAVAGNEDKLGYKTAHREPRKRNRVLLAQGTFSASRSSPRRES